MLGNKNIFKIIKYGLYLLFIAGLIFYSISFFLFNISGFWQELIFSVSLAGLIGIGTNTIAIEMLFHPVEKTFFGRQGILPANKSKIAESLAKTVRERIINENTISEYINDEDNIKNLSDKIICYLKEWLGKNENQEKIREFFESILQSSVKERFFMETEKFFEESLVKYLSSENFRFSFIFKKVRTFFKNQRNNNDPLFEKSVDLLKEIINELISDNSDKIADFINQTINDFISSKGIISNFFLKIGRDLFVSDESVRKFISESLHSKERMGKFGDFAEEVLPDIDRILGKEKHREKLIEIFELFKTRVFIYLKDTELKKIILMAKDKLDKILGNNDEFEKFFGKLDSLNIALLEKMVRYLKNYSDKGKIKGFLVKSDIGGTVYKIVKTNILKQDMNEFEKMMKKIMGENLAYIEVIGGILGSIIGLGIFYKPALLIFPILLIIIVGTDFILTKIIKKDSDI